jgi:nicotinate-nucleotide adenylyltransferase
MRIGVMGGTFDPIHIGHLRAAESAREVLRLDRVLLIPAGTPPHREPPRASAFDRWAMVCLAVAAHPAFESSPIELSRPGPSYTVDTLEAIHAANPAADVFLIVGSDTRAELSSWKDLDRLVSMCRVAVVRRPGTEAQGADLPPWATWVDGPGFAVSATAVRGRLAAGGSVRYLVPESVADYITRRELYR